MMLDNLYRNSYFKHVCQDKQKGTVFKMEGI